MPPPSSHAPSPAPPEKDLPKEKTKRKLFSKPKSIGISKDKDLDRKHPPLPSPNKAGMYSTTALPRAYNASTTSLVDPGTSSSSPLYSSANASTSTLVPVDRGNAFGVEKEKEKHKHHFLSREKNKLKDDQHNLPLSSASSNSRPVDPNGPQPLYSFAAAPASPGHSSTFAKSMSGLDLRHGGRALREKKKEEKAAAQSGLVPVTSNNSTLESSYRERDNSFSLARSEWPGPVSDTLASAYSGLGSTPSTVDVIAIPKTALSAVGGNFGLPDMGPDDAWPLLKARLLNIFEGEDPRPPIEDFNQLVRVHIQRCIQRRAPTILIEDLTELLQTGFASLNMTLRNIPDDRLVPNLVEMWLVVFTTILPFMQAVFLPLDLEFRGRGSVMSAKEAAEFWGAAVPAASTPTAATASSDAKPSSNPAPVTTLGDDLSVRRITLLTFRDTVILPRNDTLMAIFSRLSLDSISGGSFSEPSTNNALGTTPPSEPQRPSTAVSAGDPSSLTSQSTLLTSSSSPLSLSIGARSRATSNTSAGSFSSLPSRGEPGQPGHQPHFSTSSSGSTATTFPGHAHSHFPPRSSSYQYRPGSSGTGPASINGPQEMTSARVTETVGRMLQCVSVLAGLGSGDESQRKMERMTEALKYNWLGRGRTGRNRRGFVGMKMNRPMAALG